MTTYGYDSSNQFLTTVTAFDGQTTTYAYNTTAGSPSQNALTSITLPGGTHQFFTYDARGLLAGSFLDGNADAVSYTYNVGQVTTTDALGNASSDFYNEEGLISKSVDAMGSPSFYTYNSNLRLTKVTNALGESETFAYNSLGLMTSSTDFLGNTTTLVYAGPFNTLSSLTDAKGNVTSYAYDSTGDLLSTTYANGTHSTSTFDPMGGASSFVNANGQQISVTRNAAGQVTPASFSGGSNYTYTYDLHGNLLTATDADGTTSFTYDPTSELLATVTYPNNMTLAFTYNAAGQRTKMVDQSGFTVNYAYDAAGRLSALTDGSSNLIVAYTYDANGRLSQKSNGNGTSTLYQYDANGNVLHIANLAPGGATSSHFDYTYNALGLQTGEATNDGAWTYSYDADGQLIHAVFASTNVNVPNQDLAYAYDAMGNRTSTLLNGSTTAYTINNMNQYTAVGGTAYTYDADGNLLGDGTNTYTYDSLNEMTSVTTAGVTTTFTYNALGERVASTVNGQTTQYVVDPTGLGNVVGQYTGAGTLIADYTYGYGLVSQVTGSGSNFYDFDGIGSVVGVTGSNGAIKNSYSYLPFGGSLSANQTVANPFQFVGLYGVQTDAAGLDAMQARYYSSGVGRFTSPDPAGLLSGDFNFYRYALNQPTQFVDPSGLGTFDGLIGIGTGVAVGTGANVATGQAADVPGNIISSAVNIPGLPGAGPAAAFALDPNNAVNIVNGIQAVRRAGNCGGITNASELRQLQEIGMDPCGPPPPPPPPGPPGGSPGGGGGTQTVNAMDPNAMFGPAGFGDSNFIQPGGAVFPYQIDFENAATATAPAQQVGVTDQLNSNLDWSTFQLTGIGWGDNFITIPQDSQHFQTTVSMTYNGQTFNVEVEAGINTSTGQVFATFQSIDPDTGLPPANPLTGFLPPEDGTGRGDGFLSFSVAPEADLTTGTAIRNVADITFDQGVTIATDQVSETDASQGTDPSKEALVTIDAGAPTSSVAALPATENNPSFQVSWSGQDDAGGSGIGSYDIYVSDNGGAFTLWQSNSTASSAIYPGVAGHAYGFYSIARDNVGNLEATPGSAQATTTAELAGPAAKVAFTQTPSFDYVGRPFGSSLIVSVEDASGNIVVGDGSTVTLKILTGPSGAKLNGTLIEQVQNGQAVFSGLSFSKAGTYTLQAADGNLTFAASDHITAALPPAKLVFKQQPKTSIAGHDVAPAVTVYVEDSSGHLVTTDNSTVTLALGNALGATLNGATPIQVLNGVATFTDLELTKTGSYFLLATDGLLKTVKSSSFTITAETSSGHLVLQPIQNQTSTIVGKPFAQAVVIQDQDQFGNVITTEHSKVALSVVTGPAGGTLGGTFLVAMNKGVATFNKAFLSQAGSYTLAATDSSLAITTPVQVSETISPATTTIATIHPAKSYKVGQAITLTETFKSTAPPSVLFSNVEVSIFDQNNDLLANATVNSNGMVKFVIAGLAAGTYNCTIQYPGDTNHAAVNSSNFTIQIV